MYCVVTYLKALSTQSLGDNLNHFMVSLVREPGYKTDLHRVAEQHFAESLETKNPYKAHLKWNKLIDIMPCIFA